MSDVELIVFLVTSTVLILTPGQDMALVLSRSIALGGRAGVATAAGISTGLLGHTLFATLGLGAVLQASEMLFTLIKLVGAGYLVWLGVKALRAGPLILDAAETTPASLRSLFAQGALSNLANPKIAVFYFSFLPQFVSPGSANATVTLLGLGVAFAGLTLVIKAPIGYGAGAMSAWLRARPVVQVWLNRVSGCVLIGLGARLALTPRNA